MSETVRKVEIAKLAKLEMLKLSPDSAKLSPVKKRLLNFKKIPNVKFSENTNTVFDLTGKLSLLTLVKGKRFEKALRTAHGENKEWIKGFKDATPDVLEAEITKISAALENA